MCLEQIQLVQRTQQLLHGPLKHVRAAALAAALLPLASVAVSPVSAQSEACPSSGTISGFVWNDTNMNGIQDTGELGIGGAVVSLGSLSTVTDANGFYLFNLNSDNYIAICQVSVPIPSGAQPSPPNEGGDDTVDSDGVKTDIETVPNSVVLVTQLPDGTIVRDVDFGFVPPADLSDGVVLTPCDFLTSGGFVISDAGKKITFDHRVPGRNIQPDNRQIRPPTVCERQLAQLLEVRRAPFHSWCATLNRRQRDMRVERRVRDA